jgi:ribosomal protein S12 methylthiotransferase accessory factor
MPLTEVNRRRLDRIVGLWDQLVDDKVGVIQKVEELPIDDDDPDFFHYYSKACDTSRFTAMKNFGDNGGASTDRYVAIAKAMGEAVERYCAAIYDPCAFRFAAYRELTAPAVHPDLWEAYRADQFAGPEFLWHPFTVDTSVHWTRGMSLLSGREMLVPAAAVYVPYHYHGQTRSAFVMQPISTGLACGASFEEAALSGLCEVLERDAFTITWQSRLSRAHLVRETLPPSAQNLIRRFEAARIDVKLMDITTDAGVASILCVGVCDAPASPAVAVAAATDASPERALRKALDELAHTRKYAKHLMRYTPEVPVQVEEGHPLVKDQRDHLRFYCPQSAKPFAEFAWASTKSVPFEALPDLSAGDAAGQLRNVVRNTAAAGMEAIVIDLTTSDIAPLGLHVVRVVVPGAHPLYMGHGSRALGVSRLYDVPPRLGYRGLASGDMDNPYPHPFP